MRHLVLLCILVLCPRMVNAEEPRPPSVYPEQRWGIGIGLRYADIPFVSADQSVADVVPLLFYEGENYFLNGMEGGARLLGGEGWRLNAYLRYRFPDAPRELREDIRRDAWDAGVQLRHAFLGDWEMRWDFLSDLKGRRYLDIGTEARFGDDFFSLRPYLGVRLKTGSFNNYYFGLGMEDFGSGVDLQARLETRYHLSGNLYLIGRFGAYYLDRDARHSAHIKDQSAWEAFAGVAFFNDPAQPRKPSLPNTPYWRVARGWATPATLGHILRGDSEGDPFNNRFTSLFYGHPLTDRLFGLPLDIYLTPGLVWHHDSAVQGNFYEYVIAIKAYYTVTWPVRVRLGVAEGLSYTRQVSYIERTNLERKDNQPSRLLNYLDFSVDMNIGDLLGAPSAGKMWLGYGIHHRSGIFETGSQFGRIRGGGNYNTLYLQWHF